MKIILSLFLLLAACGPKPRPDAQEACGFVQSENQQRLTWAPRLPIHLFLQETFPDELRDAVVSAIATWEQASGRPLFVLESAELNASDRPTRDGVNGIYWLTEWEADHLQEQARTDLHSRESQILEADIRINVSPKGFVFYAGQAKDRPGVHLESVLIHELGHVLGLSHSEDSASVMQEKLASNHERVTISEADLKNLSCGYFR